MLPYFDRAFAPFAKTNKKIGTRPQFRVLDSQSFTQNLEARDKIFRDEFISLYIKLRYQHVQEKLNAITMRGSVSGSYPSPIGPTTKLHPRDANIIWPPATKSKPGAFYDPFTNSLNVRIDQVDPGIIAHECCHYFTAKKWDESILLLAVYDLDPTAVHIDEGVTSAVANTVLYEWNKSARPAHAPDGFAGYGSDVRRVAQKFVTHADGTLFTPGKNALGAYLGGAVSVTISKRDHWSSRLTVGTASFLMSAVR
ncbi:MAG: hypothetical protein R3B06_26440 [Kofleriaceae bacterium]